MTAADRSGRISHSWQCMMHSRQCGVVASLAPLLPLPASCSSTISTARAATAAGLLLAVCSTICAVHSPTLQPHACSSECITHADISSGSHVRPCALLLLLLLQVLLLQCQHRVALKDGLNALKVNVSPTLVPTSPSACCCVLRAAAVRLHRWLCYCRRIPLAWGAPSIDSRLEAAPLL